MESPIETFQEGIFAFHRSKYKKNCVTTIKTVYRIIAEQSSIDIMIRS